MNSKEDPHEDIYSKIIKVKIKEIISKLIRKRIINRKDPIRLLVDFCKNCAIGQDRSYLMYLECYKERKYNLGCFTTKLSFIFD